MLNKFFVQFAIGALKAYTRRFHVRYLRATENPLLAQNRVLKKRVKELSTTEFGQHFGLTGSESYEEFIKKVPIQSYEELDDWLALQLKEKDRRIITPHKVIHVEPTSGSTSARKLIPYTKPLISAFSNLFCIWAYDLMANGLCLSTGKMFISVSPKPTKSGDTSSQFQGFESDTEYVREPLRSLISTFIISPASIEANQDFQRNLALKLLCEPDLEIISIWSPTYLLSLIQYIQENIKDLQSTLSRNIPTLGTSHQIDWTKVWPRLQLISCWTSANAAFPAAQLHRLFPHVRLQGKGLLATEAPLTVPIESAQAALPLLEDIFFEFEDDTGGIKRLHELDDQHRYHVIITQSAGLTRYKTNDIVSINGFFRKTPRIEFVGRANSVSDIAGEKLQEEFVRAALAPIIEKNRYILVPQTVPNAGYILFVDGAQTATEFETSDPAADDFTLKLANRAESALCESYHYRLARLQNQLAPIKASCIQNLSDQLLHFHQANGMKLGDIKDANLICNLHQGNRLLEFLNEKPQKLAQPAAHSSAQSIVATPTQRQFSQVRVEA